jgi:hypothetical protein
MVNFFNKGANHHTMVMLTDADIKRLKKNHGVVLFFMNGCGHCVSMKDDWNMAVHECRSSGVGHARDDFVLGAIESGNTNLFKENGISHNVSGYPTILYISSEGIQRGDANHEKYENPRTKAAFVEWIKDKKNKKNKKNGNNHLEISAPVVRIIKNKGKQIGGGRIRRRRKTHKSKSKKYTRRQRHTRRRRSHMKGGGCGCGSGGLFGQ